MAFFFFFAEMGKLILKFIRDELQGIMNSQDSFGKKKKVEGLSLPNFKTYNKVKVVKTVVLE